ncbi:caspase family protein [Tropicimonas sp.]|uniref:caspase family protein n=1 Tax=Tropicimonas sp. TaxID=2067044 RepID=UPI003A8A8255
MSANCNRLLRRAGLALAGLVAGFCLTLGGPGHAETRVALVIGNGSYAGGFPALSNPLNDAQALADTLKSLDFGVHLGLDTSRDELVSLIDRFRAEADTADVALFYFAGHAVQINSKNYIFPADAAIASPETVLEQAVPLDDIISVMAPDAGPQPAGAEDGGRNRVRLVFLDACRDNPLGDAGTRAARDGLARIGSAAGYLISFATQPDNVAYDGTGSNSPFTNAILNHIRTPGQDISDMMIAVRNDVLKQTGGLQVPWENSSLTRQFKFDPRLPEASIETQFFQVAAASDDPDLMTLYLARYPDGTHATEAEELLAGEGDATYASRLDSRSEQVLWSLAQRVRSLRVVETYLEKFPDGQYAADAARLRSQLQETDENGPERTCERLATHPRDATVGTLGVSLGVLARHADLAVEACTEAAEANPRQPHFTALLARATMAGGQDDEAVRLYRDAADRGDLRAMVSLGILYENGSEVPQDFLLAERLYEQAAAGGSDDGAINLAVMHLTGQGVDQDVRRAIGLLIEAADNGSAIATYNLGALLEEGFTHPGLTRSSLEYFRRAAELGEPRGYLAAAIILDEGRHGAPAPGAAANMLLRGVAEDSGETLTQLTRHPDDWNRETLRALQARLQSAGLYKGVPDGTSGPDLADALNAWRKGGFRADVLAEG